MDGDKGDLWDDTGDLWDDKGDLWDAMGDLWDAIHSAFLRPSQSTRSSMQDFYSVRDVKPHTQPTPQPPTHLLIP